MEFNYIQDLVTGFFLFFPIFLIILNFFILLLISNSNKLKLYSFYSAFIIFIFYLFLFFTFCKNVNKFNIFKNYSWVIDLNFGIDNINILFLLLTALIFPLGLLLNWNYLFFEFKIFLAMCLFLELALILCFLSFNIFWFYVFFELTIIPMYLIILKWGSRNRKIHASYYFFMYTIFGSAFLLVGIISLYVYAGTLNLQILTNIYIEPQVQIWTWTCFFIGFSVKIPLPPFHIWLPEAHVEAPTFGSVVLAAILLKIGTFGILRFMLPIFNYANFFFSPLVNFICLISLVYISFITLRQLDIKKIIAYSSIAHMCYVVAGLFSYNVEGLKGSIYLMISHGVISAGLFFVVGMLYERFGTRNVLYFNKVIIKMPLLSVFLFIFILANFGFPLTSGFIAEFLILVGITKNDILLLGVIFTMSTIITTSYSLWLYNKLVFSNIPLFSGSFIYRDLNKKEFIILFIITFYIIMLGLFPNIVLNKLDFILNLYLNKNF